MYDNGIFVVIFLTFTFCKHRPVRNIRQPVIPLTDCEHITLNAFQFSIQCLSLTWPEAFCPNAHFMNLENF